MCGMKRDLPQAYDELGLELPFAEDLDAEETLDIETALREFGETPFAAYEAEATNDEWLEDDQEAGEPEGLGEFAERLGKEWSRRRGGQPSPEAIRDWLLKDCQDTLDGARRRWKDKRGSGRLAVKTITRAWMISRQEQMRFKTASASKLKPLRNFAPPPQLVALVADPLIRDSKKAPVAPIMVQFVKELRRRFGEPLDVSNYRGHGGGKFRDRGYSLDLFLKKSDRRGFYPHQDAMALLRAVNEAARAVQAQWRAIYNDFEVADAINRETGQINVIFAGTVRRDENKRVTGLNWHGPNPLILHFHLDLAPLPVAAEASELSAGASSGREESQQAAINTPERQLDDADGSFSSDEAVAEVGKRWDSEGLAWLDFEAQGAEAEWLGPPITEAEGSEGEDLDAGWSEAVSGEDPKGEELETFEEFDALEDSNGAETQQSDGTPAYEAAEDEWLEMKDGEDGSELERFGESADERGAEADLGEFYGGSPPSEEENGKAVDQCQARWLAEVKKFPEEVRTALLNIQTFGWQHPVAWAIKKGIRDANRLNRIAYFGSNGKSLGYCAPQTAIAKWVWATSTKAVAAFLKNPWPTVFQIGPVPCTKRQIVSGPDKPSVDITGRYYTENPARTYVINQAGVHIEGFASPVRFRVDASKQPEGDHRPLTSFEGEVRRNKIYWFNRDQPQNFGQFSKEGNRLYLGGQLLKPMEQRPTLFMGTDLDSSFDLPTRHELTPLTPDQLATIRNILNPYWLNKIFAKFHNDGNADAVGDLLRRLLNDPPCWMKHPSVRASCEPRLEQFYDVDLPLVRHYVQLVLTAQIWKNNRNTTLSHVQWIQRMLDVTMGKAPDSAVYQLYKYTGLKRSKSGGTGQHRYEFDFTLNGLSVLLAGYTGTLTVSKKTGPRTWSKQYSIELWGGNVSITLVDVKLHSPFKGAAQSDIEWTENDIPGPVRLARASASIGMDTASAQIGFMHLFGNESIPMLPVFFQDASLGYPNVFKILEEKSKTSIDMDPSTKFTVKGVVGLDAGVSVLFGTISPLDDALQRITLRKGGYDPVDLSLTPKWDVSTTHNLSAEVHFCFDTDTPTEAARQAIRIMCARELAQLMSPASTLAVVGHADTIGRAKYNKDLSERRARKTVDAIKEILASKFQIPEANIKTEGKGEDFAAEESKGQTVAAPKHRRVQVFLNAKLVLTLYSQAKQPRLSVATTSGAEAEWLEPPITEAEWSEGEDLDAGWSEAVSGEDPEGEELETDFGPQASNTSLARLQHLVRGMRGGQTSVNAEFPAVPRVDPQQVNWRALKIAQHELDGFPNNEYIHSTLAASFDSVWPRVSRVLERFRQSPADFQFVLNIYKQLADTPGGREAFDPFLTTAITARENTTIPFRSSPDQTFHHSYHTGGLDNLGDDILRGGLSDRHVPEGRLRVWRDYLLTSHGEPIERLRQWRSRIPPAFYQADPAERRLIWN